ncbi:YezD family protein [Anaerotignum sp.]|nr:YezD family protein [Anaerotignum sp.]MBQ7759359.1 YezD family protein [Anaerotignum sp.]
MSENKNLDAGLEQIKKELSSIKYGSLHITVQDGVIVLIEKNEKYKIR